jgi:hypothetical protein
MRRPICAPDSWKGLSAGVVQAQDHAGQVCVVGRGAAEIVVGDLAAGIRDQALGDVLHPAAASVVADDDVELAVVAEAQYAAVVVAAQHGQRGISDVVAVVLERPQPDDVAVEGQRAAVPDEAVDAVAQQRNVGDDVAVGAGRALGVVQVHPPRGREVGVQRDAEQPTLAVRVDREVEHRALHHAGRHPLDLAAGLLGDEEVVGADEGHRDRLGQAAGHGGHGEFRVEQRLRPRRAAWREHRAADQAGEAEPGRHERDGHRHEIPPDPDRGLAGCPCVPRSRSVVGNAGTAAHPVAAPAYERGTSAPGSAARGVYARRRHRHAGAPMRVLGGG